MLTRILKHVKTVFRPELFTMFQREYSRQQFLNDVIAGIIVGIVALPLAIAFGIASLGPGPDSLQRGLFTAVIAGFIVSCLSGSRVQIGGPTGAFIVIVYGIVANPSLGIDGLLCATLLAGIMLLLMGVSGLGDLIKYIPYPVTLGFTSGIAVVIATSQLQSFFGIDLGDDTMPGGFVSRILMLLKHSGATNLHALALSGASVAIIVVVGKFSKRIPGSLVAVLLGTLVVACFNLPVDTIGQPLGKEPISLAMGFPELKVPTFNLERLNSVFSAAVAIAMLGAIESLLSAVVADSMIGTRHRSNTELIAQGVANIVTPLFGGIPSTGAIARTATNIRNGGRTPVAGIVHAVTLLLIVLCCGPYAAMIPMPVLAGILIVVAFNMSHYQVFLRMFRAPKSDLCVMLITFLLTVLLDLTIAIPAGLILASFMFMRRMEQLFSMEEIEHQLFNVSDDGSEAAVFGARGNSMIQLSDIPPGVRAYDISGPFFFGTTGKFQKAIDNRSIRVLVLRMKNVPSMDVSGLNVLEELIMRARKGKTTILFSGIRQQPLSVIRRFGMLEMIGLENIHASIVDAVIHAAEIVEQELHEERLMHEKTTSPDIAEPSIFLPPSS